MTIEETAIVNAVIPVLFIFTPPLAGFLADKIGNFRLLLCFLTGSGGLVSLLLLLIPKPILSVFLCFKHQHPLLQDRVLHLPGKEIALKI